MFLIRLRKIWGNTTVSEDLKLEKLKIDSADDTDIKGSVKNLTQKSKVVCEDLKCFVKRDDTKPCQEVTKKNKWYSPPKNIFNPTVEVYSPDICFCYFICEDLLEK